MGYSTYSIMARIEWCRRQRTKAREKHESEEWQAEEEGLRDALLNQDHSQRYRCGPSEIFVRYAIGLQDGRVLLRTGAVGRQIGFPEKQSQVTHRQDKSHDSQK
ncbi:hypothetical protein [Petrachloros mirabilis]